MRQVPTFEQARRISHILSLVTIDIPERSFNWSSPAIASEAKALCKELSGYRPTMHCFSCYLKAANILATSIGLPPFDHGVTYTLKEKRLAICHDCPAYHSSTHSCGRLIFDAISPIPVTIDGVEVKPCGCQLDLKASMKLSKCPANKW